MTRDMTATATTLTTAAELARLSVPGKSFELVRGRLIVREPPGGWHGRVAAKLAIRVGVHVERYALGEIFGQDTGFRIRSDPDTVLAPDLAFVAADRAAQIPRRGYPELAPDLVAEILAPDDRPGELLAKVADWLDVGTRIVWVIDPQRFEARVHRQDGSLSLIDRESSLEGDDLLPGFTCPLREILD